VGLQELLQTPLVTLLRVLTGLVLAVGVLPAFVLPRPTSARSGLDAAAVRLVRWTAVVLVVSQLLAIIRLFHVLPIVLLCAYGHWYRRRHEGRLRTRGPGEGLLQRPWLAFADLLHRFEQHGMAVVTTAWDGILVAARRHRERLVARRVLPLALLLAPIAAILATSLGMRVVQAFRFQTLSPPDAYVILTWAKSFAANQPFPDGLYPPGLPALVAFVGKTTPGVDLYEIVRYTGPLIGMLLVFGLFYACLRLTGNIGAALVAAGTFGLFGTSYYWHSPWARQTGPLPQELGLAIALIALPSAVLAVTERDRDHLLTTALAALAIGLIHPASCLVFVVLAIAGAIGATLVARCSPGPALAVVVAAAAGAVVAHLYLPIGLLLGLPLFRGLDSPFIGVEIEQGRDAFLEGLLGTSALGHNPLSLLALAGAGLALVVAFALFARSRISPGVHPSGAQAFAALGGLAGIALAAVAAYDVRWIPLPTNVTGSIGGLVGIALALGLGAGFAALTPLWLARRGAMVRATALVTAAALSIGGFGLAFESGPRGREPSEYESTAAVTRDIMKNQDAYSYTVVGTPQQRQAIQGVGAFIELWVFARDVTVRDARDPGFVVPDLSSLMFARDLGESLPIPTADIYVFVEKQPFPVTARTATGPTEEYYFDPAKRGRIMATVYAWAEYYRHYHTDMDIHHEDEHIVVYRIRRRPNTVAAAASPQFKDYTWEPGVLFNGGPASPAEVEIPWRM
jgi:hypothetical protein